MIRKFLHSSHFDFLANTRLRRTVEKRGQEYFVFSRGTWNSRRAAKFRRKRRKWARFTGGEIWKWLKAREKCLGNESSRLWKFFSDTRGNWLIIEFALER